MANDDAWQAGIDIATDKRDRAKKKTAKNQGAGNTADNAKAAAGGGGGGGVFKKIMHVLSPISNLKRGGTVKKTGLHRLHKHELVVPAKKAAKVKRLMKKTARKRVSGKA